MAPRNWFKVAGALCSLCLVSCVTTVVDFDRLPDGTLVTGQNPLSGTIADARSEISNQYASVGATFSSGSPAVLAVAGPEALSPPNAACPLAANGTVSYSDPTTIEISDNNVCDVWVTITASSSAVTMTAYDFGGRQLGTATRIGATVSNPNPGAETLHINACTISKVVLTGSYYCFDDFKWQHTIY